MKKFKIILLLLISTVIYAQDDTPEMQYFVGGKMRFNLSAGMNLGGAGMGTSTYGGILSANVTDGAASIFSNPANLSQLDGTQISFNTRFTLSPGLAGMTKDDLVGPDVIADATDTGLDQKGTFTFPAGTYRRDTEVNQFDLALAGGLSSFSVGLPIYDRLKFAVGYYNPMNYSLDMLVSGIATDLQTSRTLGNNTTNIDIKLNSSFLMDFAFKIFHASAGLAYDYSFGENYNISAGFSVNNYYLRNRIELGLNIDGMMILNNTSEYNFNDPTDPLLNPAKGDRNDLFWKARGDFRTSDWGFKFGTTLDMPNFDFLFSSVKFSIIYDNIPKFTLTDENAFSESYQPKFMTGRFGDDAHPLDFVVDSIKLSQPNLTVSSFNVFADQVEISIPSSITFGFDFGFGGNTWTLNVVKYMSELSYTFDKYKFGLNSTIGIKSGFDFCLADKLEDSNIFTFPLRLLFIDIDGILMQAFGDVTRYRNPHYRFGGGLMMGDPIVTGLPDDQIKSIEDALSFGMLTGFSMGRQYTILDNLHIGVMLFGFPDVAFRYSIAVGI